MNQFEILKLKGRRLQKIVTLVDPPDPKIHVIIAKIELP